MASGKTYWWAKDAAWYDRENVIALGEQFGPGGLAVMDVLCCMAKLENDAGGVFTGYRAVGRKAMVHPSIVVEIVEYATTIGLLDDLDPHPDGGRFGCRISGWTADQEKGRATERKAKQRKSRSVTPSHAQSRPVTGSHAPVGDRTAQDSTGQLKPPGKAGEIGVHDATQPTMRESASVGQPNLSVIEGESA